MANTAQTGTPICALQSSRTLSSDIFPRLFDSFFAHTAFRRWSKGESAWQLHCIGGPGSGKSTLATLVARHLRAKFQPCVTSIHIDRDIHDHENSILESLLVMLYEQLSNSEIFANSPQCETYEEYISCCSTDDENSKGGRIALIRQAIHARLEALQNSRAFLILDGVERCNAQLRRLLDLEFSDLQPRGLSTMLTSRIAVFETMEVWCDHESHNGDKFPALSTFLECKSCEAVLCFPCSEASRSCCDDSTLHEPSDFVNVVLSIPEPSMLEYIHWSLEREHGDLGLKSLARKPPLSYLGRALRENQNPNLAREYAKKIAEDCSSNVAIAKARLDLFHEAKSLADLEARRDRLPPNIVNLFDCGLRRIEVQGPILRDIAWKAIAIAAQQDNGISIQELQDHLRHYSAADIREGEGILEAAKGFLFTTRPENPHMICTYHIDFVYYVCERYNMHFHKAIMQLQAEKQRNEAPEGPFMVRRGTRDWK